jgi:hypothetical protein
VTTAPLLLAAALVAWGPVAPGPPEPSDETGEQSSEAAAAASPASAETTAPAPAPPSPPAPAPVLIQPAIIAKAPVVVRATPAPVTAPVRTNERANLKTAKWFWALSGGLLVTAIVVTVVATRPGPQSYGGNTPPYIVTFP